MTGRYAIAILATIRFPERQVIRNVVDVGVVEAGSLDEAIGKAYQIANKVFPPRSGWINHAVKATATDVLTEIGAWREQPLDIL